MPLAMLGWDYTQVFWSQNWALPAVFLGIIGILNAYFVFNWKLFRLLEREDWESLVTFLNERIYKKNIIFVQNVRILVNAYLVRSAIDDIVKLEKHLRGKRPKLFSRLALSFGIPYMLNNNSEEMERYFREFLDVRQKDRYWIRWNYAFSLALQEKHEAAADILANIAQSTRVPVLLLLTLYLLESLKMDKPEFIRVVADQTAVLKKRYSRDDWENEIEKSRNNVQVVILSRLVEEAIDWLFKTDMPVQFQPDSTIH
jgi:hypothetical protein